MELEMVNARDDIIRELDDLEAFLDGAFESIGNLGLPPFIFDTSTYVIRAMEELQKARRETGY